MKIVLALYAVSEFDIILRVVNLCRYNVVWLCSLQCWYVQANSCVQIHTYRERERVCVCVYIYIYMLPPPSKTYPEASSCTF